MQGEENSAPIKGLVQRVLGILRRQPHGPATAPGGDVTDARHTHEQIMESVSRLAGGIAHDLNNILLVVQGYTEMALVEKDAGAETRAHLAEVRDAAARASSLVGDLLVVGRRSPLAPRLVDLNDTLSRLMPELESPAGGNIEVTLATAAGLPLVMADEEQLKRLALVLCARARDAMAGGGKISLQTQTVNRGETRYVRLRISDTGPRIPEEMRLQMFEPYFPGPTGGKGYGLRLSLVHGIVKRFGGEIEIEPGGEAGTTFAIVLPALPAAHQSRPELAPPRQEERAPESAAGPRAGGRVARSSSPRMTRACARWPRRSCPTRGSPSWRPATARRPWRSSSATGTSSVSRCSTMSCRAWAAVPPWHGCASSSRTCRPSCAAAIRGASTETRAKAARPA